MHEHRLKPEDFFITDNPPKYNKKGKLEDDGLTLFKKGQIIEAMGKVQVSQNAVKQVIVGRVNLDLYRSIRNDFAHFNMLYGKQRTTESPSNKTLRCPVAMGLNLTCWVNCARDLMSYDRKLKNAVSQSIMELLEREGFILKWEMNSNHQLCNATLESRVVHHLGDKKFPLKADKRAFCRITESLHSDAFVRMLAVAFGGVAHPNQDIGTLDLQTVNWGGQ